MKQKTVLYGVIGGLALLLYFKFGSKKAKKELAGGSSGGSTGSPLLGNGTTGGAKPVNCGDFTIYYKDVQNDFKWNNGKPTVTKTQLPPYPSAPMGIPMGTPTFARASGGWNNLTIMEGFFSPKSTSISIQEYMKGCADKKTGNFDSPQMVGGANPNGDYNSPIPDTKEEVISTGGIKPVRGKFLEPPSNGGGLREDSDPLFVMANGGAGDMDGDILAGVQN